MLTALLLAFAAVPARDTPESIDATCAPVIRVIERPSGETEIRAAIEMAVSDLSFRPDPRFAGAMATERRGWIGRATLQPDSAFFEDGKMSTMLVSTYAPADPVNSCEKRLRTDFPVSAEFLKDAAEKGQRITIGDAGRGPYRLVVPKQYAEAYVNGAPGAARPWRVARLAELSAIRDGRGGLKLGLRLALQNTGHDFAAPVSLTVGGGLRGVYRFRTEPAKDCPQPCGWRFETMLPLTKADLDAAMKGGLTIHLDRKDGTPFDWQWIGPKAARRFSDALDRE